MVSVGRIGRQLSGYGVGWHDRVSVGMIWFSVCPPCHPYATAPPQRIYILIIYIYIYMCMYTMKMIYIYIYIIYTYIIYKQICIYIYIYNVNNT